MDAQLKVTGSGLTGTHVILLIKETMHNGTVRNATGHTDGAPVVTTVGGDLFRVSGLTENWRQHEGFQSCTATKENARPSRGG